MKISVFLILLSSLTAAAAPLTLDEALARAAAQHPRLLALDARTEAAGALVEQAGYRPNPTLGVTLENFAGTGTARGVDALEGTVELSQAIERGGKRTRRTVAAEQDRAIAAAESAVARAGILGATARAYIAAVVAGQRAAFAEELVTLARAALDDAEKRRSAGEAAATESARARTALATALAESTRHASASRLAQAALAAHWGGEEADAPVAQALVIPETVPAGHAWLDRINTHPRLTLEQARVDGRRAALELEQANATPDINVAGGLRYFREGADAALVAGVSLPLPMRHRNQGAIRAARQVLAGAEFDATAAARELKAELAAAAHELAAAHAAAIQLRREALPAAEEAAALMHRAHAAAQATPLEVFEAERSRHALRRELLDQEAAFAAALVRVETLADPTFPLTRQLVATP
jgi:cobalt-zinc-cadmium efflux system outer membrane protein